MDREDHIIRDDHQQKSNFCRARNGARCANYILSRVIVCQPSLKRAILLLLQAQNCLLVKLLYLYHNEHGLERSYMRLLTTTKLGVKMVNRYYCNVICSIVSVDFFQILSFNCIQFYQLKGKKPQLN